MTWPPWPAIIGVGIGAAFGAWLRWALALLLNPTHPHLPIGTLLANLLGGFLIGIAVAVFARHPELDPVWRLTAVTGFLGGLTTFSTFSAESLLLLQQGRLGWALLHSAAHLFGALLAAAIGYRIAAV
ncbi:MAG: fluoride efflux transporter CrcB [Lautropia sp.]